MRHVGLGVKLQLLLSSLPPSKSLLSPLARIAFEGVVFFLRARCARVRQRGRRCGSVSFQTQPGPASLLPLLKSPTRLSRWLCPSSSYCWFSTHLLRRVNATWSTVVQRVESLPAPFGLAKSRPGDAVVVKLICVASPPPSPWTLTRRGINDMRRCGCDCMSINTSGQRAATNSNPLS